MVLIRSLGTRRVKNHPYVSYGLFLCPYCKKEVEKQASSGRKQQSCGCVAGTLRSNSSITHGGCGTRLYIIWRNMRNRCYNPKATGYKYYGNKGIQVCTNWRNDFPVFRSWALENGYSKYLELHRIDSSRNYDPNNCKWVTPTENALRSTKERKKNMSKLMDIIGKPLDKLDEEELGELLKELKKERIPKDYTTKKSKVSKVELEKRDAISDYIRQKVKEMKGEKVES